MILNPWKRTQLYRRGFESAAANVERLEKLLTATETCLAAERRHSENKDALIAAKTEVINALADYIRDHEWGADAWLEGLLKR
jgi:hypothetical protein